MRCIFYLFICISILHTSCRRGGSGETLNQTHARLHGKYKMISSITDQPIDINVDGTASTNLMAEIETLDECQLELRIIEKDKFLFSLLWNEQYLSPSPPPVINYACQGGAHWFSIASDNKTIVVQENQQPPNDPFHYTFPEKVTYEGPETVVIVFNKQFYTATGIQSVKVTTTYVRYTMIT